MSSYLGRLVDRAVGPPAAAVQPRLAPVFPLGRAAGGTPPRELEHVRSNGAAEDDRPPALATAEAPAAPEGDDLAQRATPTAALGESSQAVLPRAEIPDEPAPRGSSSPELASVAPQAAAVVPPADAVERPLEAIAEVERRRVAEPVLAAEPRQGPDSLASPRRITAPSERAPRIEVHIGRVEVRRAAEAEPMEWQAPAVQQPSVASFGHLAASRRYVDRGWR